MGEGHLVWAPFVLPLCGGSQCPKTTLGDMRRALSACGTMLAGCQLCGTPPQRGLVRS